MLLKRAIYFTFLFSAVFGRPAVTYEFSGGRFGDNLLSYIHARWISYRFNLPFLYRKFPFSSELVMHEQDMQYSLEKKKYKKSFRLDAFSAFPNFDGQYLLFCPYYSECEWEKKSHRDPLFVPDWKNLEFRSLILHKIAPLRPLAICLPPNECINVAVHVREGGGYDLGQPHLIQPHKFPPLSFYQDCIAKVVSYFQGAKIHLHIFSDSLEINKVVQDLHLEQFSSHFSVSYRSTNNSHDLHVLEDFFSLFYFDILIRPDSNYSLIPSLLHDYAFVFSPLSFVREEENVKINEIQVEKNESLYRELCLRHGVVIKEG